LDAMGIEATEEAIEVLRNSLEIAKHDPERIGVRLRGSRALGGGFQVQVEFAEQPESDDVLVDGDGVRIFVAPEVLETYPDALITVEPMHDIVTVRPA
jgi:Fe-S cluster assembly iron-binding protein IscA